MQADACPMILGFPRATKGRIYVSFAVGLLLTGPALAADWEIKPSLTVGETYTDNIDLGPDGSENSAFVTDVSPGISVRGIGARLNLELDYRMQNLFFAGGGKVDRSHQQLQATAHTELIRNSVFVDASSSISQQNASTTSSIATDNISGSSNRTDITTFSISPYWTPHLGGYVDGEIRFKFDNFDSDDNASSSDSETHEEKVLLRSGSRFNKVTWNFEFNNNYSHRKSGDNVQFRNYEGEVRFHLSRHYAMFVRAGRFDNDFASGTGSDANGTFKAVGAAWTPSRKFRFEALTGDELTELSVVVTPSRRTNFALIYQDRDVGTNIGETWELSFNHGTRRTVWEATFKEDTITTQSEFLQQTVFQLEDAFGNPILDPVTNAPFERAIDLPTLTDEVFRRRRGKFSVSGRLAKSNYNFQAYQEKRTFQVSEQDEEVTGVRASWDWRFARRTRATLRARWQKIDHQSQGETDKRYDLSLRLTRDIGDYFGVADKIEGFVELQHLKQDSDNSANEYEENRIAASLIVRFQ